MAEWIRVPGVNARHDSFAVNDLSPEQAVFIEPLGCSVKALRRLPRLAGMPGVVVGCGVMGLLNLAAARALGAGRLVAVEPEAQRRSWALAFGADAAFTPGAVLTYAATTVSRDSPRVSRNSAISSADRS